MSTEEAVSTPKQCEVFDSLNTGYNENPEVPPFVGVMSGVYVKSDIEVLTLELDLRVDNTTIFWVEISSRVGVYGPSVNEMDHWQIIARIEAIPMDPDDTSKGALIPN
jgi:hypothetical protein